ncbi:hypothetical protein CCACVL1_08348 [Corchorus capsularis]|uniref:Uncharacterized protein n=1 Tax=Corchorus capsularis TaxID=210143 RepID=A0A1R3J0X6_COCAP|nr:hypothetical protein CCACVL1_08348 [Corchorus capsularis]
MSFKYEGIWDEACPWLPPNISAWSVSADFWENLLSKAFQLGLLELMGTLLWNIWFNRNRALHEGVCRLPSTICMMAARLVGEVESSRQRGLPRSRGGMSHVWKPPFSGMVKMNTDASFCANRNEAGLGVVYRNDMRQVLLSAIARIDHVMDPLFTEIYAMRFGLILAAEIWFSFV